MHNPEHSTAARRGRRKRAVILLPLSLAAAVASDDSRRFLARGEAQSGAQPATDLDTLLAALGVPLPPAAGLAALRLWGQTGRRPDGWVAGADPVWLQAGLDKLYLHAPPPGDVATTELDTLFADLNAAVLTGGPGSLTAVAGCGYLRDSSDMATARLPAEALHGERPDAYMPAGDGARTYLALCGELQMSLHDHPVNRAREAAGRLPLNSLWLWGGGTAPAPAPRDLPTLIADRPLLRGYWQACGRPVADWPGSLAACAAMAGDDFVAAPTADVLGEVRELWRDAGLAAMTLLFADGVRLDFRRGFASLFRRRSRFVMTLGTDLHDER